MGKIPSVPVFFLLGDGASNKFFFLPGFHLIVFFGLTLTKKGTTDEQSVVVVWARVGKEFPDAVFEKGVSLLRARSRDNESTANAVEAGKPDA